ncbi:hypothetical protein H7198_01725 [Fructobacillus sp. CRL 2054]|uniref:hypothetical protein n=1 Tax=Fructobacillus sp. CRL 2054 TaxID=2763007 RepID=UPI0023792BE9|nr:hypothetical protein [Fructobacillus sp. CRL 2054]MDD9138332.1 hypothetical protein [Fructobacillus sp. CRL 2054]
MNETTQIFIAALAGVIAGQVLWQLTKNVLQDRARKQTVKAILRLHELNEKIEKEMENEK